LSRRFGGIIAAVVESQKGNSGLQDSGKEENAMQISLFTNGKTNTKSLMKTSISLAVAAMLLTAALAVPAAALNQVPFKGSIQGHETDTPQGGPPPTTIIADGSATGIATLVGQFSFTYQLTINPANGTATGSARLIAANGAKLICVAGILYKVWLP
jgi:hypothetical protein